MNGHDICFLDDTCRGRIDLIKPIGSCKIVRGNSMVLHRVSADTVLPVHECLPLGVGERRRKSNKRGGRNRVSACWHEYMVFEDGMYVGGAEERRERPSEQRSRDFGNVTGRTIC